MKMETEKTTLQKIAEQKAEEMRDAIEQAIDEGAEIVNYNTYTRSLEGFVIDELYVQKSTSDGEISVILKFYSDRISKALKPSKDVLEKVARIKRAELEELEKQISEL